LAALLTLFGGVAGTLLGLSGLLARRGGAWPWRAAAAVFAGLLAAGGFGAASAGLPSSAWAPVLAVAAASVASQLLHLGVGGRLASALLGVARRRWVPA